MFQILKLLPMFRLFSHLLSFYQICKVTALDKTKQCWVGPGHSECVVQYQSNFCAWEDFKTMIASLHPGVTCRNKRQRLLSIDHVTTHIYKRATEPGFPASMICTQPNGRKHKLLHFMEITLYDFYHFLIWRKEANLKTTPTVNFVILEVLW